MKNGFPKCPRMNDLNVTLATPSGKKEESMLTHPTKDKLISLKLFGMAKALAEQQELPEAASLNFEERLGLLVDREMTDRENRQLQRRLK